jgi:nicotinic acid mononucleotide adenylyltransferase
METPVPLPPESHNAGPATLPPFERVNMPYIGINSTDLRSRAKRGESLRYLVPDAVDSYIRENQLYS